MGDPSIAAPHDAAAARPANVGPPPVIGVDPVAADIESDRRGAPPQGSTRRLLLHATGWYLLNRAVTLAAFCTAILINDRQFGYRFAAGLGDGTWYLEISRWGYFSTTAPPGTLTSIGFFPLLPALIRGFNTLLPGGAFLAATVVCTVAGWASVGAVGLLARELYDEATARRAMALFAAFPGAFVFGLIYTEGFLIVAAAAALVLLHRRRWVWAGVAGAVATSARPSGLAVLAAAGIVSLVAVTRERDVKSLAAPAMTALGAGGYFAYLWARTGDPTVWFANQHDFWGQRNNAGGYLLRWIGALGGGGTDTDLIAGVITLLLIPVLAYFVWRRPPSLAVNVYVAASLVITLSSSLGPRPRFLLAAFPVLFPFATRFRGTRFQAGLAVSFALQALFTIYYVGGSMAALLRLDFRGGPAF